MVSRQRCFGLTKGWKSSPALLVPRVFWELSKAVVTPLSQAVGSPKPWSHQAAEPVRQLMWFLTRARPWFTQAVAPDLG